MRACPGNYELVVKGISDNGFREWDNLQAVLADLLEAAPASPLVMKFPFSVKRAARKEELEVLSAKLEGAGANVSILGPTLLVEQISVDPPSSPYSSPSRESKSNNRASSFRMFHSKYIGKLSQIMRALDTLEMEQLLEAFLYSRENDRQIFIIGNGGSAASASHLANDFAKQRFEDERSLFRVMSLTDNVSWMTATANDFGYDYVFVNQLKNLMREDDLVVAISSSGNSTNVLRAIDYANSKGARTFGIVGFDGGELIHRAQKNIYIESKKGQYGYMEDVVSVIGHIISVFIYEQDRKMF